jgi:7-cyano-7-deazaguanine synthase in queuosine biosynthesis
MKIRILRKYGNLTKDQIIDAVGNQKQFLLENGIACVVPAKDGCNDGCDECDDCNGKNKKKEQVAKPDAKKQSKPTKKKVTKKTGSK